MANEPFYRRVKWLITGFLFIGSTFLYASIIIETGVPFCRIQMDTADLGIADQNGSLWVTAINPGYHKFTFWHQSYRVYETLINVSAHTQSIPIQLDSFVKKDAEKDWTFREIILMILIVLCFGALVFIVSKIANINWVWPKRPILKNQERTGFPVKNRFDQYKLINLIGRGGMANVYLAQDKRGKKVALKILDESFLADADLTRKFLLEGEALTKINRDYPNSPVITVYRFGREYNSAAGTPFIAMEYVAGKDLFHFIKTSGIPPILVALKIIDQLCESLSAAHAHHIWHRDLTPDNILMVSTTPTLRIKLIDFGVAKHEYVPVKTQDGSIFGKPAYMSPEQCRGQPVNQLSDIYSLGAVFYTLLTGSPPFVDSNPLMVMKMHEDSAIPPLPDQVPKSIGFLVMAMLEKEPERRPQSVEEILKQIRSMREALPDQ